MNSTELYDEIAIKFPAVWPQMPEWRWVNVHDGQDPKVNAISELLQCFIDSQEVIVVIHSEPGIASVLPRESAASYIAEYVLKHEIQVSDPVFTRFVSVSLNGVATGDA